MKSATITTKTNGAMVGSEPKTICTIDRHVCWTTMMVPLEHGFPTFLWSRTIWLHHIVNMYHFLQNN